MPNVGCALFVAKSLCQEQGSSSGLRAVEIGAHGMYGGYRSIVDLHGGFSEYIGVDILEGPGVDVVCNAQQLVERFGRESFDIVIATELIEHVQNWREVISEIKGICKPEGTIIMTTRSKGYGYHAAPFDFWRFEIDDMARIYSDCDVLLLENDLEEPGVFIAARRPSGFHENDLSEFSLYSIVEGRRVKQLDYSDLNRTRFLLLLFRAKFWQLGRWMFTYSEKNYSEIFRNQVKEIRGLLALFRGVGR